MKWHTHRDTKHTNMYNICSVVSGEENCLRYVVANTETVFKLFILPTFYVRQSTLLTATEKFLFKLMCKLMTTIFVMVFLPLTLH